MTETKIDDSQIKENLKELIDFLAPIIFNKSGEAKVYSQLNLLIDIIQKKTLEETNEYEYLIILLTECMISKNI
jgi:hypothetical protein